MQYEHYVVEAVTRHYGPGEYALDMTFDDIGLDSLDFTETILELEAILNADLLEDRFAIGMTIREFAAEVARQVGPEEMNWPDALEGAE